MATALNTAFAISAALYRRSVSGEGQRLDVAMMDTAMVMQAPQVSGFLVNGVQPELFGNRSPTRAPTANVFQTADGYIQVVALKELQVQKLFEVLGCIDRYQDPRFGSNDARIANTPTVNELLTSLFARATTQVWLDRLIDAGVPVAEIRDFASVTADPQFEDRNRTRRDRFADEAGQARSRRGQRLCRDTGRTDCVARAAETRRAHRRNPDRNWLLALRHRGAARRSGGLIVRAVERTIVATMPEADAPNPGNPIHSSDGARDYGFRAALVGGATIYGWCAAAIIDAAGMEWLEHGWVDVAFRRPVFPNDRLTVAIAPDGTFEVRGDDARVRIDGHIGLGDAPWLSELTASERTRPEPAADPLPRADAAERTGGAASCERDASNCRATKQKRSAARSSTKRCRASTATTRAFIPRGTPTNRSTGCIIRSATVRRFIPRAAFNIVATRGSGRHLIGRRPLRRRVRAQRPSVHRQRRRDSGCGGFIDCRDPPHRDLPGCQVTLNRGNS